MYAIDEELSGKETVTLHVADLSRSHEFYQDLFGLVMHERASPAAHRLMESPGDELGVSIELSPRAGVEAGPMWLSVEVTSVSEVLDLYLLAIMIGAKAMLPRKRGARWMSVITDPDGNRIAVWTKVDQDSHVEADALRPHRWEWRLSAVERHDLDEYRLDRRGPGTLTDVADCLPGRCASGADRVDRRRGSVRGNCAFPAADRERTLEGKE
jgi:predicted enzyme related to lactoylglutathione lyase